jgi:hypothetical protein
VFPSGGDPPLFALLVDEHGRWLPFVTDIVRFPVGTLIFSQDSEPGLAFRRPFFLFLFLRIRP